MTGEKHGKPSETNSVTRAFRGLISGTMERSIRGNSNESGISNHHSPIPIPFMRVLKTLLCSGLRTVARRGRKSPDYERRRAIFGSQARVECAFTPSCSIQANPVSYTHLTL